MPNARPNIVLFITDQQRGDCLGLDPRSPAVLQTPNLDYIARSGLHCTQAYAECPSCIPARRSLMTGTAPAANGVVGFQSAEWNPAHTLAGALSAAGYQTEMIGKMHLHPPRKRFGFDHVQLAARHPRAGQRLCRVAAKAPRPHRSRSRHGPRRFVQWLDRPAPPPARGADAQLLVH